MRFALVWATTCWGLVMALAPLLQVRVVVRRRDSAGASVAWPAVLLVGFVLWLLYGLTLGNMPLILTNTVATLVCLTTVVVLLRFRPERVTAPYTAEGHPELRADPGDLLDATRGAAR